MPLSISEIHINEPLTNLSVAYRPDGFVARSLFPVLSVKKESDMFFTYGKESMKIYDGLRAPGAPSVEIDYSIDTDTYSCDEESYKHVIPGRIKDNADKPLDPFKDATLFLSDVIITKEEYHAYAAATHVTSGLGEAAHKTTPGTLWDAATGSTPVEDIDNAKEIIRGKVFKEPNTMLLPQTVLDALKTNADILNRIKYTKLGVVTIDLLSAIFGLNVIIARSGYVTDALAHTYIWNKDVIIAYVTPRPGLRTVSFGYTFLARDKRVRKWFDNEREADMIEVSSIYDHKIVCQDAGYMLENVIA